jgi:hypothetical protein
VGNDTSVYIDALVDFAESVGGFSVSKNGSGKDSGGKGGKAKAGGMAGDFADGLEKPVSDIGGAVLGSMGTTEAQMLRDWYYEYCLPQLNGFSPDVLHGFMYLGSAAIVMAANYREGDRSQAENIDKVMKLFHPDAKEKSAAEVLAADAKKHPQKDPKATTEPPPGDNQMVCTVPSKSGPKSPAEQRQEHDNSDAGKHENWYPGNPDYDPMNHPQMM